jgi:N-acetylmuramoyl-L-alanine amidase
VPRIKTRDVVFVLAIGLLLWGAQHHRKWPQMISRPGTRIALPQFPSPDFDRAPHLEIEVDWLTELGEHVAWSSMRLAEQFSQRAANVADGLRSPWSWPTRPTNEHQYVRTVVVDPGHGGRDPGATGVGGLHEKEVTLRLSRALRSELETRGFRVITTRYGDQTVSLRRRIAIAEQEGGDLFVSLHANAAPQPGVQGIVTYYPDKNYARHILRVAAAGNGTPAPQLDSAERPPTDSSFTHTSDLSAELARSLHHRLVAGVRERYRSLADLGVRSGPFYVLFLSSMPSVLVEAGFLTHPEEAARMQSDAYVSLLAAAIADGIASYRDAGDWDRTLTAATLSPPPKPST